MGRALREFRDAHGCVFGEDEPDRAASDFLEPGGRWNELIDAVSTYYSGAELDLVSARDLARYEDTGVNWRAVEGYGGVVARHGADLRVELDCKVRARRPSRSRVAHRNLTRNRLRPRVIVTLPSRLIAEERGFLPARAPEKTRAAAGLPLGLADKLFLSLSGAEAFEPDSRAFGAVDRTATAAYQFRSLRPAADRMLFRRRAGGGTRKGRRGGLPGFRRRRTRRGCSAPTSPRRVSPRGSHPWGSDPLSEAPIPTRCRAGPTIARRSRRRSTTGSSSPARPARAPIFPPRTGPSGPA